MPPRPGQLTRPQIMPNSNTRSKQESALPKGLSLRAKSHLRTPPTYAYASIGYTTAPTLAFCATSPKSPREPKPQFTNRKPSTKLRLILYPHHTWCSQECGRIERHISLVKPERQDSTFFFLGEYPADMPSAISPPDKLPL